MDDIQIVEIQNHWFVHCQSQFDYENEKTLLGEGKTREQALENALKFLHKSYKKLDEALVNMFICSNERDTQIRTKFSYLYFNNVIIK